MARKIVVVGGGAAGMGAAGGVKAADPASRGGRLHRVRGRRLQPVRHPLCARQGDRRTSRSCFLPPSRPTSTPASISTTTPTSTSVDVTRKVVQVAGEGEVAVGHARAGHRVQLRRSRRPGRRPRRPLLRQEHPRGHGVGQGPGHGQVGGGRARPRPSASRWSTALAHRGIETHLVDPSPWPMSEMADPDIMAPVEESWRELGVITHFNTTLEGVRRRRAAARGADLRWRDPGRPRRGLHPQGAEQRAGRRRRPQDRLDRRRHRRRADGDVGARRLRGRRLHRDPARADPRTAAGPDRQPRLRAGQDGRGQRRRWIDGPTARCTCRGARAAGKWIIGGASFGETTATALGIPYVVGTAQGISRARYYPGVKPVKVKLLAEPGSLRLHRRPDGRRRGHQGARRLPRDGGQVRVHAA